MSPSPRSAAENTREVVERAFREEGGRALATLIRILRDFDLAEEAVQDAFAVALARWPADGVPRNPGAWITRAARNKAIDRLRRERRLREKTRVLAELEALGQDREEEDTVNGLVGGIPCPAPQRLDKGAVCVVDVATRIHLRSDGEQR